MQFKCTESHSIVEGGYIAVELCYNIMKQTEYFVIFLL
jgi:hypothetical protein